VDTNFLIVGVFGFAARVHSTSKKVTKKLKVNERKMKRRIVDSLPVLKIGFGSANFVDETTPIVNLNFIIFEL